MKTVVTGFIADDSNFTNPDNTGSAKNTQITVFKVFGLIFTWIFSCTNLKGITSYFSYSIVMDFFKNTF